MRIFFQRMVCIWFCIAANHAVLAQHTIKMRHLWIRPQVHVHFNHYTVSFTIKDINKAIKVMNDTGDSTYGVTSGLDTLMDYQSWLNRDHPPGYLVKLDDLLQNGVGVYLILSGHAEIRNKHHRKRKTIITDISVPGYGDPKVKVEFFDTKKNRMIFSGTMNVELYGKDLGIWD